MTILLANIEIILVAIFLVIFLAIKVKQFLTHPSEKRQELILIWLVEAVNLAEERYGSGTGQIKLSMVYSKFIEKFGFLGQFVSKEVFNSLVDKALEVMKETFEKEAKEKQPK